MATLPDSAIVGIPAKRFRFLPVAAVFSLLAFPFAQHAGAATTLTATTLLIAPEYRLPPAVVPKVKLAIVIDDVGYNLHRAERLLAMPKALTLGMLPYAPYAQQIAERAARSGREVILHQPMQPLEETQIEPGTLEVGMSDERFDAEFTAALARLPQVSGVNNHTGSLLTARRLPMERLMHGIARRGLYFLDSRTTPDSIAESTARSLHVPTIRRDVFLDHVRTDAFLNRAFENGVAIARRKGYAVVIAHPHQITLDFLEDRLARLPPDVELTTLGALVRPPAGPDQTVLALLGSPGSRSRSPDR